MPFKKQTTPSSLSRSDPKSQENAYYLEKWPRVDLLLQQAKEYEEKKDFERAFRCWDQIVRLDSSTSDALEKAKDFIKRGAEGYTTKESREDLALHVLDLDRKRLLLEWALYRLEQLER
jgi:hypothetical protein